MRGVTFTCGPFGPEGPTKIVLISLWMALRCLLLGVVGPCFLPAAEPEPKPTSPSGNYFFETISPKLGLSQADIITALQTRDGYLWVGSGSGLARFDGVRFVSFRLSNTPAFLSHLVSCLMEDRDGSLWIGTERGVIRYRDGEFTRVGAEEASVRAIVQDAAGRVWCGTFGQGLYVFEHGVLRRFDDANLPSPFISTLWADGGGRVWVGFTRAGGVSYFENGAFHRYFADGKLMGEVQAIAGTADGALWFGSRREGLSRLKDGTISTVGVREGGGGSQVYELRPARDGGLWVMTDLLQKVGPRAPFGIQTIAAPLSDRPGTVCEDHEGGTWICGRASGLVYGRLLPYRTISTEDGLPGNGVRSVAQDTQGNIWLSVLHGGLVEVTPDGRTVVLTETDGLPANDPEPVLATRDGAVWVGFSRGLYRLKGGTGRLIPHITGVGSLFESRDGTVWIGTNHNGVYRGRDDNFSHVDLGSAEELPFIASFAEAPDGTMFFGSWSDGLIRFQAGRAEVLSRSTGLPSNEVRTLYVDRVGRLWVGMRGRGLAVWENGRWMNPDRLAEAVGDQVNAIAEDDYGQLWLGTPGGVIWAPMSQLLAAARDGAPIPDLRVAEISDTHPPFVVRSGKQPIVCRTNEGELLFATRRGIFGVDPEHVGINRAAPPVQIERLASNGRAIALNVSPRIPAGSREISIDYTAISFVGSSRMQFRYKVDGYDSDWVDAGMRRTAIYTNLPPRDYVFRVKACNGDGVWNETGAALAFTVEPFFWQTWWFALSALVVFTTAIFAVARYVSFRRLQRRLQTLGQQAALDQERARIARDIHDDIGNRLTTISLLSGLAYRDRADPEKAGSHARVISSTVRQVTDSLDEIVWAVNPRNDTLPHLINYLGQFAVQFLSTAGIECHADIPDHPPVYGLSADVRHNLFLVVKEALNNVVRHAGATEVTLRIGCEPDALIIVVSDNGRGFAGGRAAAGADGLRNMEQRMAEIGGTFQIESGPGAGTRVTLTCAAPTERSGGNLPLV
jgi:signal transduction histidine kinase/ligand-binding sensor domain-containing protein